MFDRIRLDPCSNEHSTVGAEEEWHGCGLNGLEQCWQRDGVNRRRGIVFVNAPWSDLDPWVRKACHEWHRHGVESLLWTPAYTETKWAQAIWAHSRRVAFWKGRVKHPLCGAIDKNGSMWPTMMSYFGDRAERFERVFRGHANVVELKR